MRSDDPRVAREAERNPAAVVAAVEESEPVRRYRTIWDEDPSGPVCMLPEGASAERCAICALREVC